MIDLVVVQKAIYDALKTLRVDVVDYIDTSVNCPYVHISNLYINDDSNKTNESVVATQYINIYSEYKGKKEVLELASQVDSLMINIPDIEDHQVMVEKQTQTITQEFVTRDEVHYKTRHCFQALLIYEIKIIKK